jgi:lysozyme
MELIRLVEKDIEWFTSWEGMKLEPYDDGYGFQTIYIGHKILPGETFNSTEEEGLAIFAKDIETTEHAVAKLVNIATTHNQWLALCSLIFNCGADRFAKSDTRRVVNKGIIPDIIERWKTAFVTAGGIASKGLLARREAEAELWLT